MKLPALVTSALEGAINHYLKLDPYSPQRLSKVTGKVIGLELRGLSTVLYLHPTDDAVHISNTFDAEPDAWIRATPAALFRMGADTQHDSDMLFGGDVAISGDVDVGQQFKSLLRDADIDWEEQLSRFVGDIAAHSAGNAVRSLWDWAANSTRTLMRDSAEYLHEESMMLPPRRDVDVFLSDVDALRTDVDRLEARVNRLHTVFASKADDAGD